MTAATSQTDLDRGDDILPRWSLTDDQLDAVCEAVRSEVGEVSVRFRHTTRFSPLRVHLHEVLDDLRTVLSSHQVTRRTAAAVAEVLQVRVDRLHAQRHHCDSHDFAERLAVEEGMLTAVLDALHEPPAA